MSKDLAIPSDGRSIRKVTIVRWIKHNSEFVNCGEVIAELEIPYAVIKLTAPASGRLQIRKPEGYVAKIGEIVGQIDPLTSDSQVEAQNEYGLLANRSRTAAIAVKRAVSELRLRLPLLRGWESIFAGVVLIIAAALHFSVRIKENDGDAFIELLLGAFGLYGLFDGFRVRPLARSIRWILNDRCAKCGYDLRATSDRCPECGILLNLGPTNLHGKYKSLYHDLLLPEAKSQVARRSDEPLTPN